jgi:hypothetical protein
VSVFLVITGSEKHDVLDPDVYGPFPSEEAAEEALQHHPRAVVLGKDHPHAGAIVLEPYNGGYIGWKVVSAKTAVSADGLVELWDREREEDA